MPDDANRPSIDQRLDRLTERHEALAQTVELMAASVNQLSTKVDNLADQIKELTSDVGKLTGLLAETGQFINQLAHIAAAHEQRLDRREGPPS